MPEAPTRMAASSRPAPRATACRCCGAPLVETVADLGMTPLANAYVTPDRAGQPETFYPLRAMVCSDCRLVQLADCGLPPPSHAEYRYYSSFSASWLRHCEQHAETMIASLGLDRSTEVVEVASNDGYLLQYFARRGIPVLGVEPAQSVAEVAIARGIPTEIVPFGATTARRLRGAGHTPALICANNVMAHVPDIHDLVEGFRILLAPGGVLTAEFTHLLRLMQRGQFDTIYHDHYAYFSLTTAELMLAQHGLVVFDVEELPTHGGSLRIHVRHIEDSTKPVTMAVEELRRRETASGLNGPHAYSVFAAQVVEAKCALLDFLVGVRRAGLRVAGYGAPAKGNTLLNYCGVGPELLPFTVDASPHKQGLLLPGTRIPIRPPGAILEDRPDFVLILPWNLRDEIVREMAAIRDWGGRFVTPIPNVKVF